MSGDNMWCSKCKCHHHAAEECEPIELGMTPYRLPDRCKFYEGRIAELEEELLDTGKELLAKAGEVLTLEDRLVALPALIVEKLFTNGYGDKAVRLAMMSLNEKDLGGWCKDAAFQQIKYVIKTSKRSEA